VMPNLYSSSYYADTTLKQNMLFVDTFLFLVGLYLTHSLRKASPLFTTRRIALLACEYQQNHHPQTINEVKILGVCGGIGSGKSSACKLLVSELSCLAHIGKFRNLDRKHESVEFHLLF
jgi:hypothetical protein